MHEVEAIFDGAAIHPEETVDLPVNSKVRLQIERIDSSPGSEKRPLRLTKMKKDPSAAGDPFGWLHAMAQANLVGPPDMSENVNKYLNAEFIADVDDGD